MIVLKIIGWILLGLLAVVILALCVKLRISCEYSEENTFVALQWLFLRIPLYPKDKKKASGTTDEKESSEEEAAEEKTPSEEKEAPEETGSAQEEASEEKADGENKEDGTGDEEKEEAAGKSPAPKKKKESLLHIIYRTNGIDGILLLLKRLFSYLGTFLGDLINAVIVEDFSLDIRCSKSDAAMTAIYYGEVCSAVFPMLGALVAKYRVKDYDINIYPDFLAKFSSASFAVTFWLRPLKLVWIVLVFACRLVFKVLLRMFVKIFLSIKKSGTEKQNKKNTEKRVESK